MTLTPDRLSAEARRWVKGHRGPRTKAVTAVLEALPRYYADMAVVEGIVAFHEDPPEHSKRLLATLGYGWTVHPDTAKHCDCHPKCAHKDAA